MKKLTTNIIVFLTMIALLQLVAVGSGSLSWIDESSYMITQAGGSIAFLDSNDVNDVNSVIDVNDVNDVNDPDVPTTSE